MPLLKKKPVLVGNNAAAVWVMKYCPCGCGCKLRSDGRVTWCSYVNCRYIREATKDEKEVKYGEQSIQ